MQGLCRLQGRLWLGGGYRLSPEGPAVLVQPWGARLTLPWGRREGLQGVLSSLQLKFMKQPGIEDPGENPTGLLTGWMTTHTRGSTLGPFSFIDWNQDKAASSTQLPCPHVGLGRLLETFLPAMNTCTDGHLRVLGLRKVVKLSKERTFMPGKAVVGRKGTSVLRMTTNTICLTSFLPSLL